MVYMCIIVFTDVGGALVKLLYHKYMFIDILDVTIKMLKDISCFQLNDMLP